MCGECRLGQARVRSRNHAGWARVAAAPQAMCGRWGLWPRGAARGARWPALARRPRLASGWALDGGWAAAAGGAAALSWRHDAPAGAIFALAARAALRYGVAADG